MNSSEKTNLLTGKKVHGYERNLREKGSQEKFSSDPSESARGPAVFRDICLDSGSCETLSAKSGGKIARGWRRKWRNFLAAVRSSMQGEIRPHFKVTSVVTLLKQLAAKLETAALGPTSPRYSSGYNDFDRFDYPIADTDQNKLAFKI